MKKILFAIAIFLGASLASCSGEGQSQNNGISGEVDSIDTVTDSVPADSVVA